MFGVYVVVIVFGERVIVFQSKPCVMNPVSILYISPMTDKKPHTIQRTGKNVETSTVRRIKESTIG